MSSNVKIALCTPRRNEHQSLHTPQVQENRPLSRRLSHETCNFCQCCPGRVLVYVPIVVNEAQTNLGFLYQMVWVFRRIMLRPISGSRWLQNGAAENSACSRSALKALAQIVTTRQLRDGQSRPQIGCSATTISGSQSRKLMLQKWTAMRLVQSHNSADEQSRHSSRAAHGKPMLRILLLPQLVPH